jgi:hypothetical protein
MFDSEVLELARDDLLEPRGGNGERPEVLARPTGNAAAQRVAARGTAATSCRRRSPHQEYAR